MSAEGDTLGVTGDAKSKKQHDDGEDVGHVPTQTENIH